jgi:SpoVK/Ycf46/Vps4 family AAA+-type ATPase
MILLGKLYKLVPTDGKDILCEDDNAFSKRNELILDIEHTIHEARGNMEAVSTFLKKNLPVQLETCRRLESISRGNPGLSMSVGLLPMAKSLGGALRRQKLSWLQSLQLIQDSFEQIYVAAGDHTKVTNHLQLAYKRLNRRCINPDRSPWKEAIGLLECVASGGSTMDDTVSRRTRTSALYEYQDAVFMDLPIVDSHSIMPVPPRHFASPACATLQLQDVVNDFFKWGSGGNDVNSRVLSILLVGPEGSGKTFLLDKIKNQPLVAGMGVDVIHPVLAFDAIGTTVGAAEDMLISMICYATTQDANCLLLLDDIDVICGQTEQYTAMNQDVSIGQREPHSTARLRYLFFSLLDSIRERNYGGRNSRTILICTSKENFGKDIDRFDKILPLLPPDKDERRQIISSYVDIVDVPLQSLVECTVGLSRAELAHHCREALSTLHSEKRENTDTSDFFGYLKEKVQSSTPESLKHGVNADFVDMNVLSARDLQQLYPIQNPENPSLDLPLFGESVVASWEELRRLIVLPVCQGSAIDKILYYHGGISSKKVFAGGVLLAAPPGAGKSTLANFCAAVASSINPSIKLIDVSCTSLIHKEVGGSERALHRLFQSARAATPCIVVMDGIENIAAVRGNDNTTEGTMDRLLSTLLTELDGVESETSADHTVGSMAIIGITHNPQWIDPALRRPGRLERTIWLDNPDLEGRKRIIMKELGDAEYRPDSSYPELETVDDLAIEVSRVTGGYTGAELISICNESKLSAFNNFFNEGDGEKSDFITPRLVFDAVRAKPSD